MRNILNSTWVEAYEPAARFVHVSFVAEGKVYLWGGQTQDGSEDDSIELANCLEQFDPYLEVWSQRSRSTTPWTSASVRCLCIEWGTYLHVWGIQGSI